MQDRRVKGVSRRRRLRRDRDGEGLGVGLGLGGGMGLGGGFKRLGCDVMLKGVGSDVVVFSASLGGKRSGKTRIALRTDSLLLLHGVFRWLDGLGMR